MVQHRYEWLYVYGFVEPKTGKTLFYLIPRVNTQSLFRLQLPVLTANLQVCHLQSLQ